MSKKQYDMVVSLGGNCAAAIQLNFRGLRNYSLPFDYLFMVDNTPIKWLHKGFMNNFEDFFLRENMIELEGDERGDDRHGCIQYKDTVSGYRSIHAFKKPKEDLVEYQSVLSMYRRRFDRLLNKINESKRISFILACPFEFDVFDLKPLQDYLQEKYINKKIDWYILMFNACREHKYQKKLPSGLMTVSSYRREMTFEDFSKKDLEEYLFLDEFVICSTDAYRINKIIFKLCKRLTTLKIFEYVLPRKIHENLSKKCYSMQKLYDN